MPVNKFGPRLKASSVTNKLYKVVAASGKEFQVYASSKAKAKEIVSYFEPKSQT